MINILIAAGEKRNEIYKKYLKADDVSVICIAKSIDEAEINAEHAHVILLDFSVDAAEQYIKALRKKNIPILSVADNAQEGFAMMGWGAADMQLRSANEQPQYFCNMVLTKLRGTSKKLGGKITRTLKNNYANEPDKIIAIGSSTGGTNTVENILRVLPGDMPPILIVQHMPPVFTQMFAERLHSICKMSVWEAREGDPLMQGLVLIAPGDLHMVLVRENNSLSVSCINTERVCNQRPAADVLFNSISKVMGRNCKKCLGIILTGMGNDGAKGLLSMRNMGAATIGQDKESSVVYGMPRAAYEIGAVENQLHMNDIAEAIIKFAKG